MENYVELQAEIKLFLLKLLLVCLITAIDPANTPQCSAGETAPESLDALAPFAICVSHCFSV